jgi:CheY-like chemotaxis protein
MTGRLPVTELSEAKVLIIDEKGHGISLLKSILIQLGVKRIAAYRNTDEALHQLRQEQFDVVFCDELAAPLNPVAFVKTLRRDLTTKDVTVPVILVSAGANRKQIELARDAGANDLVAKPVSAETVERKIRSLVLTPHNFVTAKTFLGPDRRRGDDRRREPRDGIERRGMGPSDASVFHRPARIRTEDNP